MGVGNTHTCTATHLHGVSSRDAVPLSVTLGVFRLWEPRTRAMMLWLAGNGGAFSSFLNTHTHFNSLAACSESYVIQNTESCGPKCTSSCSPHSSKATHPPFTTPHFWVESQHRHKHATTCAAANSEVDLIMHQDKGDSTGGVIFIPLGQMCSIIMQWGIRKGWEKSPVTFGDGCV